MTGRIVLGGLVGGVVLFMWGFVWHDVLDLGHTGIHGLPDEEAVMSVLEEGVPEPGMYFFPYWDHSTDMGTDEAKAAMEAWEETYEGGPIGLLVYHPTGVAPMSPMQLGTEFVTSVAAAIVVAFLLSFTMTGFAGRLLFVVLLGLVPVLAIHVPYWNWFGFPADYTLAVAVDEIAGWLLAGIPLAAIVKRRGPPAS